MLLALMLAHALVAQTVGPRDFDNAHTVHLDLGVSYLDRADLLASPGLSLTATHYLTRSFAIDYVNASLFDTLDKPEAGEIHHATGYSVARERPLAQLGAGARYAFAYGKMLIEHTQTVLHFVPELALHLGVLVNHGGHVRPEADASLALRLKVSHFVEVGADVTVMVSVEGTPAAGVWGAMPRVFVGTVF